MDQDTDTDSSCTITNDTQTSPEMAYETNTRDAIELQIWAAEFLKDITTEHRTAIRAEILREEMYRMLDEPSTSVPENRVWDIDYDFIAQAQQEHTDWVESQAPYVSPDPPLEKMIGDTEILDVDTKGVIELNNETHRPINDELTDSPFLDMEPIWNRINLEHLYNLQSVEGCMLLCFLDPLPFPNLLPSSHLAARQIVQRTIEAIISVLKALMVVAKLGQKIEEENDRMRGNHLDTACQERPERVREIMEEGVQEMRLVFNKRQEQGLDCKDNS